MKDNDKYATQRMVFDDLGQGVLDNAFAGTFNDLPELGLQLFGYLILRCPSHINNVNIINSWDYNDVMQSSTFPVLFMWLAIRA